jgi:hypothetical protein
MGANTSTESQRRAKHGHRIRGAVVDASRIQAAHASTRDMLQPWGVLAERDLRASIISF